MGITLALIIVLGTVILAYYFKLQRTKSYWTRKGVYTIHVKTFDLRDVIKSAYDKIRSEQLKFGAVNLISNNIFIPVDLDLINRILIKDFDHFVNRTHNVNAKIDPLTADLARLTDEPWRALRTKLTPAFTSGKIKMMTPTIAQATHELIEALVKESSAGPVDMRELLARFTTDVMGRIAFGIECNTMKEGHNEFRKLGRDLNTMSLKFKLSRILPGWFLDAIGLKMVPKESEEFIKKVLRDIIAHRESKNICRRDFLHMLLQIKNRGKLYDDDKIKDDGNVEGNDYMTFMELVASAVTFFNGGFETSSTTMSFALLELAQNQEVQDKLRRHVRQGMKEHGGLTYNSVIKMGYLEQVINEALRMHPPAIAVGRKCTKNYTIPGSNVTISKGDTVMIPIYGLHHDERYFENPSEFNPDRFASEIISKRPAYTFIPFGDGPRSCIGARFGLMESKIGLAAVVSNFKVTVHENTKLPIKYSPKSFLLSVEGDVWLNMEKVSQ